MKTKMNGVEFQVDISKDDNVLHYPTLKTVLMIEKILQKTKKPLNKSEIKNEMDVKIMHQTLNLILDYLEERGLIVKGNEGYVWTFNPSKKLDKAIKEGREM